jgi:ATP-dependent Clp protease, protease subunit
MIILLFLLVVLILALLGWVYNETTKKWRKKNEVLKLEDVVTVVTEEKGEGAITTEDVVMNEVYKKELITQNMLCESFEANNRILKLNMNVEEQSAWLMRALLALDADSSEDITLIINSYGGDMHEGCAIIDTIGLLRSDVSTVIIGEACSMAAVIAMSGTKGKRYATKNSSIMIRKPKMRMDDKVNYDANTLANYANQLRKDTEATIDLYVAHTKETRETITEKFNKGDTWMNAEEALKLDYIDGIILKGLTGGERVIQRLA